MPGYSRTARETLVLAVATDGQAPPPWAVFDPFWYRGRYPDALALSEGQPDATLLEWHLAEGQRQGHSPNRYFDEEWQRQAWPGIAELIRAGSVASAFDAWCRGPNATRAPHWLFDPLEYRNRYPAMTDEVLDQTGFINRYHHYLKHGASEGRVGHALFVPAVYLANLEPAGAEIAAAMPFAHYLAGLESGAPERRTSLLFDPDWYRRRYPEAARAVADGRFRSRLEHYLRNDQPESFDPSPWFSEAWYRANNPGLADAIGPEGFRNGFVHFRLHGAREERSPHPDLDLAWYAAREPVRADIEAGRVGDAYEHWIAIGRRSGLPARETVSAPLTPAMGAEVFARRAEAIRPLFGRRKLDFRCRGTPAISAIVAVRDRFAATLLSLASLRAQYKDDIELLLIGSDDAFRAAELESQVSGAVMLRFSTDLTDAAVREAGVTCAGAEAVLLLGAGIELAPGSVDAALARLYGDDRPGRIADPLDCDPAGPVINRPASPLADRPPVGAVGARLVRPHGMLWEAGGIVWRDGRLQAHGRDAHPLAAEASFVREVDYCSTLFLLARRSVLASLPEQSAAIAGTGHDAADLCLRIRGAGFGVVYEPDALAFLMFDPPGPHSDSPQGSHEGSSQGDTLGGSPGASVSGSPDNAMDRMPDGQLAFAAAHARALAARPAFDPGAIVQARSPDRGQRRVLFVEDSVPLRRIGSGFERSNDILRAMVASGACVTVLPMERNRFSVSSIRTELPDTVEVMYELTAADVPDLIAARRDYFDLIWIARTHNLDRLHEILLPDVPSRGDPGALTPGDPGAPTPGDPAPWPAPGVPDAPADPDAALSVVWRMVTEQADPPRRLSPVGQYPLGQYPLGQSSAGQSSAGQSSAGQSPVGQSPVGQSPAGQSPLGQYPLGQSTVGHSPGGHSPAGRPPEDQLARAFAGSGARVPRIVVDTKAITSVREAEREALSNRPFDLDAALRHEFRHLEPTMGVVAVTAAEAALIGAHHASPISILGHGIAASPTARGFADRTGMLFVGAIHAEDHPNHEGLVWFIENVLPLIEQALGWETRLTVAGYVAPGITLDRFRSHPRVTLHGEAADLAPLYASHRVFVAPSRFAAGIPYKVHEAAAFGLPVVTTVVLARQLDWADGKCIGAAGIHDPAGFAARVVALHRDAPLWERIRAAALARVTTDQAPADFTARVARILEGTADALADGGMKLHRYDNV